MSVHMKKVLKDFKEFALKGNVLDLAVGVIIGGAFGKIVTSVVNDLMMPIISVLVGGMNFSDLKFVLVAKNGDIAEVAIRYGAFLQATLDFVIIAGSIFLFIKAIAKLKTKKEEEDEKTPEPTKTEVLLTEIRDLLAQDHKKSL